MRAVMFLKGQGLTIVVGGINPQIHKTWGTFKFQVMFASLKNGPKRCTKAPTRWVVLGSEPSKCV
jgi:hypothetical protein